MEELTSGGEVYIEHGPEDTIMLPEEEVSGDEYILLTAEDVPIAEYGAIGAIACGSAAFVSIGVSVVIAILRRG